MFCSSRPGMDAQKINLEPNPDGNSVEINRPICQILTGPSLNVNRDTFKVRSNNISTYRWESRLYEGRVIDVHRDGIFVAYVLTSRNGCVVRVYNRMSKARALIKGFNGACTDIGWAKSSSKLLLACVDETGNLFLYRIQASSDHPDDIIIEKLLVIRREREGVSGSVHRLSWCPYVPDVAPPADPGASVELDEASSEKVEGDNDDLASLLAVAHDRQVEMVVLELLLKSLEGEAEEEGVKQTTFEKLARNHDGAYASIEEQSEIMCACLAPDATALALGTKSGEVKFYILENFDEIRCAHTYSPHRGKPVDSLLFPDNLKDVANAQDQFWKFALTASNGNRELKLWNCESWMCTGTLALDPSPAHQEGWGLLLRQDWTGDFIILSDIERKSLYIVEMSLEREGVCRFRQFFDLPFTNPIIDLSVVCIANCTFRSFSPSGALAQSPDFRMAGDEEEGGMGKVKGVEALIYAVNPKCLLELHVRLEKERPIRGGSLDSGKDKLNFAGFCDRLSDVGEPKAKENQRTSPSSDEVRQILEGSRSDEEEDEEDEEAPTEESVKGDDAEEEEFEYPRPATPVAHTLDREDSERTKMGDTPWAAGLSVDGEEGKRIEKLVESVEKMSMELERVVSHLQKQEQDLAHFQKSHKESGRGMDEMEKQLVDVGRRLDAFQTELKRLNDESAKAHSTLPADINGPILQQMTDDMRHLETELKNRLTSLVDLAVKDQVAKVLKNKGTIHLIGQSVAEQMAAEVKDGCRTEFSQAMLPAFQNSMKSLFDQINDGFHKGLKEYTEQFQQQSQNFQSNQEEFRKAMSGHVTEACESLRTTMNAQVQEVVQGLQTHIDKQMAVVAEKLQETTALNVRGLVREELRITSPGTPRTSGRSVLGSPTPSVVHDRQAIQKDLTTLLSRKEYEKAFQEALSACDLSILSWLCEKVDPLPLFGTQPPPLSQPVLMSLIQQLCSDLTTNTVVKLRYIEQSISSVDESQPEVTLHLHTVVTQLMSSLQHYRQNNPSSPHLRMIRMILMASKSLLMESGKK